jgi:hypothetical protein
VASEKECGRLLQKCDKSGADKSQEPRFIHWRLAFFTRGRSGLAGTIQPGTGGAAGTVKQLGAKSIRNSSSTLRFNNPCTGAV